MAEGTHLQTMDVKLTQHEEILTGLTAGQQTLQQTQRGIQRTLELIQDRLTTLERRPAPVPDVEYDGTGCCVRSIDCECNICIGNESLNCDECCVCSIDFQCDICIENDATSPENEGLNCDETEINRPSDFHVLDDLVLSRVWDIGWQWSMHPSIVQIDSVCSYAIMPTYSSIYSGKGDLSAFHTLEDLKVEFDSFVLVGIRERYMPWG